MAVPASSISVVIPAFNRRREILRAIASLFRQTLPPAEIVVVDDASTDGTPDAVAELGDSRLNILRHTRNLGAAAARNTGIAAARGDWIAFLDSDDEWESEKLARQREALADGGADTLASVTGYAIEDYRTRERYVRRPTARDATLDALVWGCWLGLGSTLLARREAFATVGLLDPDLPRLEDWDWLIRYLQSYSLLVLPDSLATVHKATDPSFARVAIAVARIREKHRDMWYRRSWLDGRKFDSTLLVEEAAAAYYTRDISRAALLSIRALASYPFRGGSFIHLLVDRAFHARQRAAVVDH